jgi:hypothetical protein
MLFSLKNSLLAGLISFIGVLSLHFAPEPIDRAFSGGVGSICVRISCAPARRRRLCVPARVRSHSWKRPAPGVDDVEAFTVMWAYVRDGPSFFFPETVGSVSDDAAGGYAASQEGPWICCDFFFDWWIVYWFNLACLDTKLE